MKTTGISPLRSAPSFPATPPPLPPTRRSVLRRVRVPTGGGVAVRAPSIYVPRSSGVSHSLPHPSHSESGSVEPVVPPPPSVPLLTRRRGLLRQNPRTQHCTSGTLSATRISTQSRS